MSDYSVNLKAKKSALGYANCLKFWTPTYRSELVNVLVGRPQGGESDLLRKLGELRVREHGRVTQEIVYHISER